MNVNKVCHDVSSCLNVELCVGDFLVIDSSSIPRFDCEMTLKEDYDFTAQHLHTYGQIARLNRVFVKAKHYTNAGGAVAVRNDEREQYNIKILRRKWPGVFRAIPGTERGSNVRSLNQKHLPKTKPHLRAGTGTQRDLRFEEMWYKRTASSSCERI